MLDDVHDPRVIERQMKAVEAVHQVVHIIWLMAQTQLTEVDAIAAETSTYLDWVDDTVARLAGQVEPPARAGEVLHVIFGPERGYCGSLARDILDQLPLGGRLGLVGANLVEHAARRPEVVARVCFEVAGASGASEYEGVAHAVAAEVLRQQAVSDDPPLTVLVHYPPGLGSELHAAVLVGGLRRPVRQPPETFSPMPVLLDAAVSELITGRLAVAAIEALRSEVRARLTAADRARHGCERREEQLLAGWRVARQAQITGELLEVVAGHLATG